MQLNKSLGTELYRLFGPNGSDQILHRGETRRVAALVELQRHGLVKLVPQADIEDNGLIEVKRQTRGLVNAPQVAELVNALELAVATIERLQRHAPGTAKGTLDVIAAAIAQA